MPENPSESPELLTTRVVHAALEVGFVRAGVARPERSEQAAERLAAWLAAGHHGEMRYMAGELDRSAPSALFACAITSATVSPEKGNLRAVIS